MIRVLPAHISNLIAAGEVVQRPASVVKELVENAVDAGATNIHVIIRDSGRTLIQIIDDGCGMSPEDARTAFLRHATSKITSAEDLSNIHTFGFRGEALASVCSVAEVTLRTKRANDDTGIEIKFAESKQVSEGEVSTPNGSNFMVRNLFYNIPARRKFLKSDATEFRQILSEFSRIAITRPDIHFRLSHNSGEILNLPPATLKKRIQDTAGKDMGKELVEISVKTSIINISGYIGKPEDSRKTPGYQYLFANNRYFRSPYFQKAVLKAYDGLIQEGTLPSFFIFFETDPQKLDVNIHPSKTEIKFEDDSAIFDILYSGTRESLGKNSFMPSIDFDQEGAPDIPKVNTSFYVAPPKINYDPLFNPFKDLGGETPEEIDRRFHSADNSANPQFFNPAFNSGSGHASSYSSNEGSDPLFNDEAIPAKPLLQISGKYIMTTIKSGVILIDIKRARERILYEKYTETLREGVGIIQQSLFPVSVEAGLNTLSILKENESVLKYLGFDISFNHETATVSALPEGFSDDFETMEEVLDNLAEMLSEEGNDFGKRSVEQLAAKLAKTGSFGKNEPLNNLEAQTLVDTLFACKEPNYTPSGNSCLRVITVDELSTILNR
ncbi:MAG: DNA mismatch repair protein MutL [Bacteroidetes bacterium HGW-Bacteroidetes-7]|jgi:DNA mismatch repair protein MutL|nr:MAG: DNA mismatch repair protein MutL [Bacteroidetes bacterium HGW-Bacteroidetes-7]